MHIVHVIHLPGGSGESVPPDLIPNSEVKRLIADDSVGSPYVKVAHSICLDHTGIFKLHGQRAADNKGSKGDQ